MSVRSICAILYPCWYFFCLFYTFQLDRRSARKHMTWTIDHLDLKHLQKHYTQQNQNAYSFLKQWNTLQDKSCVSHKASLNISYMTEKCKVCLPATVVMILEISYRKEFWEFTNMWKLKTKLLNNQWAKGEIKREIRKIL